MTNLKPTNNMFNQLMLFQTSMNPEVIRAKTPKGQVSLGHETYS